MSSPPSPLISVCILAGHGFGALEGCLRSLVGQESPPSFELLVGGDPGPEAVAALRHHFPDAGSRRTGQLLPGAARNVLIEQARGELLLFLDDDVTVRPDLLHNLVRIAARYPEATVFGGPNDTPPGSSRFQAVQGAVLSSLIGSGPVSRRYGARHSGFADERWFTLCNLAVRRAAMSSFPDDLRCAEENALLAVLRRRGDRMRYEPDLRVFHARRPRLSSFAAQMLKYGQGRGALTRRDPTTARAAYLAPSALLLYAIVVLPLIAVGASTTLVLLPAMLYGALTVAGALWIAGTLRRARDFPLAAILIVLVHACYGFGLLRGLGSQARPGSAVGAVRRDAARAAAEPSSADR